jgi:predicted transcriptional regulator
MDDAISSDSDQSSLTQQSTKLENFSTVHIFSPFSLCKTVMRQKSDISTADIAKRLGCHLAAVHKHIALFNQLLKNMPLPPKKTRKGLIWKINSRLKERMRPFFRETPLKVLQS